MEGPGWVVQDGDWVWEPPSSPQCLGLHLHFLPFRLGQGWSWGRTLG
jgi:hypothetical protein